MAGEKDTIKKSTSNRIWPKKGHGLWNTGRKNKSLNWLDRPQETSDLGQMPGGQKSALPRPVVSKNKCPDQTGPFQQSSAEEGGLM